MITNYGTLQAAVARRAVRSDLTDDIPDFIRAAHDQIVGEVVVATDLTLDSNTVALPDDFRQAVSLWLIDRPWRQVCESSPDQMQMGQSTGSGVPFLFRVESPNLILWPSPEPTWPAKLLYRISTDFFADGDATNVILTKYPNVYLYGAMAALGLQTADDSLIARWRPLFLAEIARINGVETGDALRGPLQATSNGPVW